MPENFAGPLRRFSPDLVLLVDALQGGAEGVIRWIEMGELSGVSAFTHGLPLSVQAEYLERELGCQVGLIAIKGDNFNFGEPLTPHARRAANQVVRELLILL